MEKGGNPDAKYVPFLPYLQLGKWRQKKIFCREKYALSSSLLA